MLAARGLTRLLRLPGNGANARWPAGVLLVPLSVAALYLVWTGGTALAALGPPTAASLIGGVGLYLASHVVRGLRLLVLINSPGHGPRHVLGTHFVAAGVSHLLPFKLGEVVRYAAVGRLTRGWGEALLVLWIERAFDAVAITGLLLGLLFLAPQSLEPLRPVILAVGLFGAVTFLAFFSLPENLGRYKLYILRRYHTPSAVRVLAAMSAMERFFARAPAVLRKRWSTLLSLSAVVWGLEVAAWAVVTSAGTARPEAALTGPLLWAAHGLTGRVTGGLPDGVGFDVVVCLPVVLTGWAVVVWSLTRRAHMDNVIVSDLDGTLTVDDKTFGYDAKPLRRDVADALARAAEQGFRVVVATARSMRTYNGDVEQIRRHTQPVIEQWLKTHGISYEQLIVGKPWCGPRGFYVDDRNMHPEEFVFRFTGPYAGQSVVVATLTGSATPEQVGEAHEANRRLERYFDVREYVYLTTHPEVAAVPAVRDDKLARVLPPNDVALVMGTAHRVLALRSRADHDPAAFVQPHLAHLHGGPDLLGFVHGVSEAVFALVRRDRLQATAIDTHWMTAAIRAAAAADHCVQLVHCPPVVLVSTAARAA